MKRFTIFLNALVLFSAFALMPLRTSAIIRNGDVDWNLDVEIADVIRLVDDMTNGTATITDDVDGNLEVNIMDVTKLIDYLMGGELVLDLYYPPVPDSALVINVNGVSFAMMPVQGGSFTAHGFHVPVMLSDFYMGMTEVTMEIWDAVMESRPSGPLMYEPKPNQPMCSVSWYECQEFITRLNELTGLAFHMPTPDQFQYAVLGGQLTHGYTYAGSDDIDEVAWYKDNRHPIFEWYYKRGGSGHTMPVGMKKPNELGIYDLCGNVEEMTESSYFNWGENYDTVGTPHAWAMGGSVLHEAVYCIPFGFTQIQENNRTWDRGFRLVLQASSLPAGYRSK